MVFLTANSEEMNISSEIFPTDGSNFSSYLFNNGTEMEQNLLYFLSLALGLPTNSYVIWLIVTGTGNGFAAEFFSLNLSACEIFLCVETVFLFLIIKLKFLWIVVAFLEGLSMTGRPLFQCLICVERCLAVVHPVTFLKFKPLRYKVICSVIAWVATFVTSGIIIIFYYMSQFMLYIVFLFAHFFLFLSVELFCLVAVLRALKQSGPGERGRERGKENHMKRRAFYLILITTVTTLFIYGPYIILMSFMFSTGITHTLLSICSVFFVLAGLVQPLLFLYRVRKLPFIKYQ